MVHDEMQYAESDEFRRRRIMTCLGDVFPPASRSSRDDDLKKSWAEKRVEYRSFGRGTVEDRDEEAPAVLFDNGFQVLDARSVTEQQQLEPLGESG